MKKVLFVLAIAAFTSCSNNGSDSPGDSTSVQLDTASTGTMSTDTTGTGSMNADTTGMGAAR